MTIAEMLAQVESLRAELDQRHGDQWPQDAVEQFERAVADLDAAMQAAEARAERLRAAEERMTRARTLAEPMPARTLVASAPQRRPVEHQPAPIRSWTDAFRAWALHGETALTAEERTAYLGASDGGVGWRLRYTAAPPSSTGEDLLAPVQLAPTVRIAERRAGLVRRLATVRPTSSDVYQEPFVAPSGEYVSGQITSTWPGAAGLDPVAARTALQQTFQRNEIRAWPWEPGHVVISRATIEDAATDVQRVLEDIVSRQEAIGEDEAFLVGNGNQRPQGMVTDTATPTVNAAGPTQIVYDDLINVYVAVRDVYAEAGSWIVHPTVLAQILRFKDTAQRPLFVPGELVLQMFGRPIYRSGFMQTIAANNRPVIFGDISQYVIVDRTELLLIPLRERYAPHLGFAIWARKGGKLLQPEAVAVLKMAAS